MYQITDRTLKKLKSKIWNRFLRAKATTKFDELNVIKSSKELYKDLKAMNRQAFLQVARDSYKQYCDKDIPSLAWVLAILAGYDEVSRYVYNHEVDRKRARFAEDVIATGNKMLPYQTANNLWYRQTKHFMDTMEREATLKSWKDLGYKKVVWITKTDGRECKECRERHLKVYDINKVPERPHINCRCRIEPKGEQEDD